MSDRLNYYFRQKVSESELDEGFALLEQADRTFVTDLSLVGAVTGLVVTQRGAGANLSVDISAGTAYDKNGARIHTSSTQNVGVSVDESSVSTAVSGGGNSKIISVFAKFTRTLTDPRTDGNSVTVYFSEAESFAFVVRQSAEALSPTPVALDGEFILLADITRVFGGTTVVNGDISIARREDCFVHAGSPHALRRGRIKDAFADIFDDLNTEVARALAAEGAGSAALAAHIANPTAAHAASAVSYGGSGLWADGASSVVATDLESALDEIVSDLASTAGASYVGTSATSATYLFGTGGGGVQAEIDLIRGYLDLGPRGRYVSTYAANQGLTTERQVLADTSGGAVTLTLPAPAHGIEFYIKDKAGTWGTNNMTLAPNGGEKIEGVAGNRVFAADFGAVRVWSDGTDWYLD